MLLPTSNVLSRVVKIRGASEGTGLLVDIDGRQYLASAHHVIGSAAQLAIDLFFGGIWHRQIVDPIGVNELYDVAVVRLSTFIDRRELPLKISAEGLVLGEDTLFIGFPFGEYSLAEAYGEGRVPIPFVKRACVSMCGFSDRRDTLVLDGINNIGFSGGPIVFSRNGALLVAGLVTGYREEERLLPYAFKEGHVEKVVYAQNTGLIYGAASDTLLELIRANPTGHPFPD